ncbi:hypothetical protein [Streptomyces sp. NPDC017993]|uniref:hypothetical protein n=1 Tax=Streptomyces sp. NPDC017993 TaxID=3365027 RepID=UPI0037B2644B
MTEHEGGPHVPVQPARDHRGVEAVMKAVLIVAAVAGAALLLYVVFFIGMFALAS